MRVEYNSINEFIDGVWTKELEKEGYVQGYNYYNDYNGSYFICATDVKNFVFGEDYLCYDDGKIKWCESFDFSKAKLLDAKDKYQVKLVDKNNNVLEVVLKNAWFEDLVVSEY